MGKRKKRMKKRPLILMAMMLPGMIYLIINNYVPMVGIIMAFKKYDYSKGMWKSNWTGISNFRYLFQTKDAYIMIRNTLLYNFSFIFLGTLLAVAVAVILNEIVNKQSKKIYQTLILIPYLISMIVVSYIAYAMLGTQSGLINNIFFRDNHVNWYVKKEAWPYILIIVNLWKSFGYVSIVYYASIIGINKELYEAATVDGANRFKRIFHVTLPGIKVTVITMVLLAVGKIFRSDFGLFYQVPMNSGLLSDVTTTIDVYVYKGITQLNDIGRASAAGFFQAICGFIIILIVNKVVRKIDQESALF